MSRDWQQMSFTDVVRDETGGNIKTLQSDFLPSGRFPIVDQGKGLIAGYTNDESRLCKADLPVIIFGDHTKCFKFIDFPFCLGADGTKVLRPKINVDERYLFYAIRQIHIPEAGYSRHFKYLKQGNVPLPSLEEQKRIAATLDQADELRRLRQEAIAKLNALGQSIFYEMFGDPATNPNQWPMGTIRDLVAEVRYGTSKKAHTETRGLPILRMGNITYEGEIDLDDLKYVELADKEVEKYTARKGDILFNRTNSKDLVGKTAIYELDEPMAIAGYLVRARVNDQADPYYIGAYMNSKHGKATLRNMCKNIVGMANINAQEFQDIQIAVPPLDLQREYGKRIEGLKAYRGPFHESRTAVEHLFSSLQQRAFKREL